MLSRFVAAAWLLATSLPAFAGDSRGDADDHARRGVALYKLGRYGEAIEEFEQAYLLYPSDMLLYNLGQSHRQLDHCHEALGYYRRFLDAQPESPLAGKVSALIPPLEHACEVKFVKPDDVASNAAAPAVEQTPAIAVTEVPPPAAPVWRMRLGLDVGALVVAGASVMPIGPSFVATRTVLDGKLDVGGLASLGLFAGDLGTTGSSVSAAALAVHSFDGGPVELRVGGGPGLAVLSSLVRGLVTDPSGREPIVVPELVALGSVDYSFAAGWVASAGAELAIGGSSALRGGVVVDAALSLAIGYRP